MWLVDTYSEYLQPQEVNVAEQIEAESSFPLSIFSYSLYRFSVNGAALAKKFLHHFEVFCYSIVCWSLPVCDNIVISSAEDIG